MSMSPITAAKRMAYQLWPQARRAITSLQPVVPVVGLGTLAVDKHWRLYYDPEYVSGGDFKEPGVTILHELMHLLWGHCWRGENLLGKAPTEQAQELWNIVCDLKVNRALRLEGLPVPSDWVNRTYVNETIARLGSVDEVGEPIALTREIEDKWSVERIFNLITKGIPHANRRNAGRTAEDSGGEGGDTGDIPVGPLHPSDAAGDAASGDGVAGGGSPEEASGGLPRGGRATDGDTGSPAGDHPEGGRAHSDTIEGDRGRPNPGRGVAGSCADGQPRHWELPEPEKGGPELQRFDHQPIVRNVANAVLEDNKNRSHGTHSGSVAEWAVGYINPATDPYTSLMKHVLRTVSDCMAGPRSTYTRPNRRRSSGGLIIPGKRGEVPRITVCVDTSGSMVDHDKALAVGLINRVLNRFHVRSGIRVITGDTAGRTSDVVSRKLEQLFMGGGGGTDMRPLIKEAQSTSPKPHLILVVTDGGTDWPERSEGVPVVACITRPEPDYPTADWMGEFCLVK